MILGVTKDELGVRITEVGRVDHLDGRPNRRLGVRRVHMDGRDHLQLDRTGRGGAVSSTAISRSEARAASIMATYSSSSSEPVTYDSRSIGVSAKPVELTAASSPLVLSTCNIGTVPGR
jgi:hypothetical protein